MRGQKMDAGDLFVQEALDISARQDYSRHSDDGDHSGSNSGRPNLLQRCYNNLEGSRGALCMTCPCTIICIILIALGGTYQHEDDCKYDKDIPNSIGLAHWMVITGLVTIFLLGCYVLQIAMGWGGDESEIEEVEKTQDDHISLLNGLAAASNCVHCIGFFFLLAWWCYGTYIVIELRNASPLETIKGDSAECKSVLFNFSVFVVIILVAVIVLSCCCWVFSMVWGSTMYRHTFTAAPCEESYDDLCSGLAEFDENDYYAFEDEKTGLTI